MGIRYRIPSQPNLNPYSQPIIKSPYQPILSTHYPLAPTLSHPTPLFHPLSPSLSIHPLSPIPPLTHPLSINPLSPTPSQSTLSHPPPLTHPLTHHLSPTLQEAWWVSSTRLALLWWPPSSTSTTNWRVSLTSRGRYQIKQSTPFRCIHSLHTAFSPRQYISSPRSTCWHTLTLILSLTHLILTLFALLCQAMVYKTIGTFIDDHPILSQHYPHSTSYLSLHNTLHTSGDGV